MSNEQTNSEITSNISPPLNHPLGIGSIVRLSFDYYVKDLIFHLLPFIILAIINFAINAYVIDILIPYDHTLVANYNPSQTIPPEEYSKYYYLIANIFAIYIANNIVLSVGMGISVLVVKNTFLIEKKTYSQIIKEIIPLIPKLMIIGAIISILTLSGLIFFFVGILITVVVIPIWFCLVTVIIVQKEDESFFSSLRMSRQLISPLSKNIQTVFGILIAIGIIQYVLSGILSVFISAIVNPNAVNDPNATITPLESFFIALGNSLFMPLSAISMFFLTIEMKWRKENPFYHSGYQQPSFPYQQQPPPYQQQPPPYQQQPPPYQQPPTKFCGYCGAPALTKDDKFCARCGKTFPDKKIVID